MKDCPHYQQLISCSLDEPLPSSEQTELDRHLQTCESCRDFERVARRQQQSARELPHSKSSSTALRPSATARRDVMSRLWRARISVAAPLAAALLIAAASWLFWTRPDTAESVGPADRFEQATEIIKLEPAALQPVQQDSEAGDI